VSVATRHAVIEFFDKSFAKIKRTITERQMIIKHTVIVMQMYSIDPVP